MPLEFVSSTRGKHKLLLNQHLYLKTRCTNTKVYWKCDRTSIFKCKARVTTDGDRVVAQCGEHNHPADPARVEAMQVHDVIRDLALTTAETPGNIVANACVALSVEGASHIAHKDTMRKRISNIRARARAAPLAPPAIRSLQELVIPKDQHQTAEGEPFLLYDSGPSAERMLIFSTTDNLNSLTASRTWFADGSIKTLPDMFAQLYTIHGDTINAAQPLVYALLPNKTAETYKRLFQQLRLLAPTGSPSLFLTDIDQNVRDAIAESYPATKQQISFFHFTQSIYQKIQEENLQNSYENDVNFSKTMDYLAALAFVPIDDVVDAFAYFEEDIPDEAQGIINFFEDYWIGRRTVRGGRRIPQFSLETWNCYEDVRNHIPNIKIALHEWQRCFEHHFIMEQLNIWTFLEKLRKEQNVIDQNIQPLKKFQRLADRLYGIVVNYNKKNTMQYLKDISNIIYL